MYLTKGAKPKKTEEFKMKNTFSKKTIDLIKQAPQKLANNPCTNCELHYNGSCCGCPDGREYLAAEKEYESISKKALEAAHAYRQYFNAKKKMEKYAKQLTQMGLAELIK